MRAILVAVVVYACVCVLAAVFLSKLFGLNPRDDASGDGEPDSIGREVHVVGVHGPEYVRFDGAKS